MKSTKVVYILHEVNKSVAFEWITQELDSNSFELSFILLNSKPSYLKKFLDEVGVACVEFKHKTKLDFFINFFRIFSYMIFNRPDVVHTHLKDANLLGLSVANLLGIRKRIHTRHHSTYHHTYHPKAVKYDKLTNHLSTDIIAISRNVKNILIDREAISSSKITTIHHGFMLRDFEGINKEVIEDIKRKYNPASKRPVIGVIARYMKWKGIQYIIPAFKRLLTVYPDALLILANAKKGDYKVEIGNLLRDVPSSNYKEIDFESNLFALYQLFDVFVHTPINAEVEAYGQIYVEALAAGIPSVFSLSGVASEFIKHRHNALVVDYKNEDEIFIGIKDLIEQEQLRQEITENGKKEVEVFDLPTMINKLESLYKKG